MNSKHAIEKGQVWHKTSNAFLYRVMDVVRGRVHLKISDYPTHEEKVETATSLRENYTLGNCK